MILLILMFLITLSSIALSFFLSAWLIKLLYFNGRELNRHSRNDAIIITGCDSGIGLELSKYFYTSCKFKIICGFLNPNESEGFKQLSDLVDTSQDSRLILKKLDITSKQDVEGIVKLLNDLKEEKKLNKLIALVNNAGTMTYGEFDWLTWDQIQSQIEVNFTGTLRLTRAVLPYILESRGRVINISSVNDKTVFPGLSVYSATKGALSIFSRALGLELRKLKCHVVTVRLGDFARLTNIMSKHPINQKEMWKEMSSRKRQMYERFFHEFNEHLLKNYGMTSPKEFEDSSLFSDLKLALLAKNPPTTITCAPFHFKVFYFVIELCPNWLQNYILDILIEFGFQWKPPRLVINQIGAD